MPEAQPKGTQTFKMENFVMCCKAINHRCLWKTCYAFKCYIWQKSWGKKRKNFFTGKKERKNCVFVNAARHIFSLCSNYHLHFSIYIIKQKNRGGLVKHFWIKFVWWNNLQSKNQLLKIYIILGFNIYMDQVQIQKKK